MYALVSDLERKIPSQNCLQPSSDKILTRIDGAIYGLAKRFSEAKNYKLRKLRAE